MKPFISHADIEHVNRIYADVKWWQAVIESWNPAHVKLYERVMPRYMIIAYAQNMLDYWNTDFKTRDSAKTLWKIRETLRMIEETVMCPDFPDIELRMVIIRMYHDAGYQTAGQQRLEL